ncbi:uncharacterized protein LOC144560942 isoform X3 [Carex rostrata]
MAAKHLFELLRSPVRVQRCAGRINQTELVVQIDQRDVVVGDIVHFSPGDLFPGDIRLITSRDLIVSQSSLTGESGTVQKTADVKEDLKTPLFELRNICFMGTSVVSGIGTGLVISTRSNTYIRTILSKLGKVQPPDAFDKGVQFISYTLICIMLVAVPVLILSTYLVSKNLSESIIFGICVAVVLTPQMLPLIVNTNLARGAVAMARNRCIVKSISAIQHMGAMDILCIDKTGTLTMDRFIMVHHLDIWGFPSETVLKFAFLNSYFKMALKGPVDDAVLAHAYTNGYRFHASAWRKLDEFPFDFTRRRISVVIEAIDTDVRYVVTKGAFEEVLGVSAYMECPNGRVITSTLTIDERLRLLQMSEEMSNDGLVVLGVAIRKIPKETDVLLLKNTSIESDMTFLGLISFFDPPKDSAKYALYQLAERGISPKILTGDSLSLTIKVCKEVGIATTHTTTGVDLNALDEMEFHETVNRATIFARLTPTQKLHVVQSLQKHGNHVVGFLGDGINDSLALDAANVGISVDSGANIAKKSADIILLEKDLNVLVFGVEHGRLTYGNTMKYIKLSLVANFSSAMSLIVVTICMQLEPLSPRQLLTQNFIYSLGQIAIPWDKMEDGYAKTPQIWSWKELPIFMLWNGSICSIFDISMFIFVRLYYRVDNLASSFFKTAWFVESLVMQTLIIHMIRTTKIPFLQDMSAWPVLVSTVVVIAVAVVIPYTLLGEMMGLTQLPFSYLGFLLVLFVGYFSVGQVAKRIYIKVHGRWL